jgi:hypothetical protein
MKSAKRPPMQMTEVSRRGQAGELDTRKVGQPMSRVESAALGFSSGAAVDPTRQGQLPGTETHQDFKYLNRWEDIPQESKGNSLGQEAITAKTQEDFGISYDGMRERAGAHIENAKQGAMDRARRGGASGLQALEAQPQGRDFYGVTERNRIASRAANFGIYDGPNDEARPHLDLPKGAGTDYNTAASMVAAQSPQVAWQETPKSGPDAGRTRYPNIDIAEQVAYQESNPTGHRLSTSTGTPANAAKAARIYGGEDPHKVLGGDKVKSFNQNLTHPWRDDARTTVDTHMLDALSGVDDKATGLKFLGRKGNYEMTDRAIRDASRERLLTPEEGQSVIWHEQKSVSEAKGQSFRHEHTRDRHRVMDERQLSLDIE